MGDDDGTLPTGPVFVIRLYKRRNGNYEADIANSRRMVIAVANAPDFWALWDTLASVLRREVLEEDGG